jgi:hypothetical protein
MSVCTYKGGVFPRERDPYIEEQIGRVLPRTIPTSKNDVS